MEFNQALNRVDTSTGSTYSPKMIEGERTNLKKITEGMRKTNFHLGYKK
jgi:response regulator RpfG family c-di-GMP phosphodiesterase